MLFGNPIWGFRKPTAGFRAENVSISTLPPGYRDETFLTK